MHKHLSIFKPGLFHTSVTRTAASQNVTELYLQNLKLIKKNKKKNKKKIVVDPFLACCLWDIITAFILCLPTIYQMSHPRTNIGTCLSPQDASFRHY